jgi:hypothetical protein
MEEAEARKLQPHFIRSFFIDAFRRLGGQITPREPGRFEITNVPAEIRNRGRMLGAGVPVVPRYTRVTFERELVSPTGFAQAQLLAPRPSAARRDRRSRARALPAAAQAGSDPRGRR